MPHKTGPKEVEIMTPTISMDYCFMSPMQEGDKERWGEKEGGTEAGKEQEGARPVLVMYGK